MSWKELSARWKAESPVIFKRITNLGASMVVAGGAVITPQIAVPNFHVPEIMTKVAGYLVTFGFGIGIVSKITCKDPSQLPTKQ